MACPAPANVWANSGYSSGLGDWLRERCGVVPEIVARQAGHEGFVPLPRRWIVGRTFTKPGRSRRPSKDYEF